MKSIYARLVMSVFGILVLPAMLLGVACDDVEPCYDVSCDNHEVGSTKFYQKCCDRNEEGNGFCWYVTGEGERFDCDYADVNCLDAGAKVVAWCKQKEP